MKKDVIASDPLTSFGAGSGSEALVSPRYCILRNVGAGAG
jgi:hypothetical protein